MPNLKVSGDGNVTAARDIYFKQIFDLEKDIFRFFDKDIKDVIIEF